MMHPGGVRSGRNARGGRVLRWALSIALMGVAGGCEALYPNVLRDADGQAISFAAIQKILSDTELTEDQQRTALQELGITDENLIDLLIRLG